MAKPHSPHKLDPLLFLGQGLRSTRKDSLGKFSVSGSHHFHERTNAATNKVTPKNKTCEKRRALPSRLGSRQLGGSRAEQLEMSGLAHNEERRKLSTGLPAIGKPSAARSRGMKIRGAAERWECLQERALGGQECCREPGAGME